MFTTMNPNKYNTMVTKYFKIVKYYLDGRVNVINEENLDEYDYFMSLNTFCQNIKSMECHGIFLMEMYDDDELLLHSSSLTGFLDDVFKED